MKKSSEKTFGLLFFFIFIAIGFFPLLSDSPIRIWSIIIAIIFLLFLLFFPNLLKFLNNYWVKLGDYLGKIISPIIMALIFFSLITPLSFIIRLFGKDILKLKTSNSLSYWIKRDKNITTMDKQF